MLFVLAAIYFVVVGRTHPGRETVVYTEARLASDRAAAAESGATEDSGSPAEDGATGKASDSEETGETRTTAPSLRPASSDGADDGHDRAD